MAYQNDNNFVNSMESFFAGIGAFFTKIFEGFSSSSSPTSTNNGSGSMDGFSRELREYDTNSNNAVSINEIIRNPSLAPQLQSELRSLFDPNSDGKMDIKELVGVMRNKIIDKNQDGKLDKYELKNLGNTAELIKRIAPKETNANPDEIDLNKLEAHLGQLRPGTSVPLNKEFNIPGTEKGNKR